MIMGNLALCTSLAIHYLISKSLVNLQMQLMKSKFSAIIWILLTKFLCFVIFLVAIDVSAFFQ